MRWGILFGCRRARGPSGANGAWRTGRCTLAVLVLAGLVGARRADAHVNSPDLVHEGMAGPYRVLVTIRPPEVIPGVAAIEVLAPVPDLRAVTLVPLPIAGPAATSPPVADVALRSRDDVRLFTGKLWLMATGSWQVRVHVEGPLGAGELAVPVPALALRTRTMPAGLGVVLLALLAFLFAGLVSIIGASARDADLPPGVAPDRSRRRRARIAEGATAVLLLAAVAGGHAWWNSEAAFYRRWVYKPLALAAALGDEGGTAPLGNRIGAPAAATTTLALTLTDPGWLKARRLDDLLPDHGHLMHLFAVKLPGLEVMAHLHPIQIAPGRFVQAWPSLPAGRYQLFADIVHGSGLGETATTILVVPARAAARPTGDDVVGFGPALVGGGAGDGSDARDDRARDAARLPDGSRLLWLHGAEPLVAGRPTWFRFRAVDGSGQPVRDLVPYMGMAGHAVFLKHDRSVFAHVHPSGSVPMAALGLLAGRGANPHAGHDGPSGMAMAMAMAMATPMPALPPEIAFPYVFPQAGDYRIFVQYKRGEVIETATFDARVDRPAATAPVNR
jgi:hypothetical protein